MKILMLTWEFPPVIAGGLGMACYGIVKSLLELDIDIDLVLPTNKTAYFPLREPQDADELPVVFLDQTEDRPSPKKYSYDNVKIGSEPILSSVLTETEVNRLSIERRLHYLGVISNPETYINFHTLKTFRSIFFDTSSTNQPEYVKPDNEVSLLRVIGKSLKGSEDIFKKVQEYTVKATQIAATNNDYDIIHAHDWLTYPPGMLIKKVCDTPLITHIHATEFDRSGGSGDERVHNIEYSGMAFSDSVIAVSKYTAQMIINRYRIGPEKINIVHNAYSSDAKILKTDSKKRIFKGPTILFLGRITIQKGPDYFLDVAKQVLKKHPQARFIMAGTGDMARKLLHKSASYRLKNRFLFAGFLNRKEVEDILSSTDIYLLPSVSEPFGIAPLEAMAYGITAIISKQSGVSEVVDHAYKIDFWDIDKMVETIDFLIENPEKCRNMGIKGMREVEKIRWDDAAAAIKTTYKTIKQTRQHN